MNKKPSSVMKPVLSFPHLTLLILNSKVIGVNSGIFKILYGV